MLMNLTHSSHKVVRVYSSTSL
ncbi:unnamed protein product [Thlaspi arvense]|uniref:Uncharacterized protein n=1 Tax=Thlaspi arvense TaxID=13288 RepID=A0AAU9RNT2_THLAR|nr:unnamed protein product [Thlaspi arvense]